jgi:hypothetical protein
VAITSSDKTLNVIIKKRRDFLPRGGLYNQGGENELALAWYDANPGERKVSRRQRLPNDSDE